MQSKDTGLIFKKTFKSPRKDNIYKPHMNGMSDPTMVNYTPISTAVANKPEIRKTGAIREWVDSYKEAAEELSIINQERCIGTKAMTQKGKKEYTLPIWARYAFYSYYYTLPTVFLIRHAAELAIKEAIEKMSDKPQNSTHNLIKLWSSLMSHFPKSRTPFDEKNIREIGEFLRIISHLDDDGIKVRYAFDKNGNYTHEEYEWVNCIALSKSLDKFVEVLRSMDCEYIKTAKKTESE